MILDWEKACMIILVQIWSFGAMHIQRGQFEGEGGDSMFVHEVDRTRIHVDTRSRKSAKNLLKYTKFEILIPAFF